MVDHTRSKENVSKLTTKYNEKKSFAKWKQEIHDYISIGSDDVIYTIYKTILKKKQFIKKELSIVLLLLKSTWLTYGMN